MTEDTRYHEEFVQKVRKLSTAIINYKKTRDASKRFYDDTVLLKEEVLNDGLNLGLSSEIVVQMVYDMTKNQLTEWYVRRLFSGDFNKDIVQVSNNIVIPVKENRDYCSNISAPPSENRDLLPEELEFIFDLKHASHMGLKDAIQECDKSTTESYLIKIRVKDLLVVRIENEITGFVREDLTV